MSNKLLDRIRMASAKTDKIPPGARSTRQWAKLWKKSVGQTGILLNAGVASKIMRGKPLRVLINGAVRRVPYYWEA